MASPTGILLMAYGTPETIDQVEPYFTHIRGGRTPSPESVARLQHRYQRVGGRTPLLEITRAVARGLETELNSGATAQGDSSNTYRVYTGMKHWHPYIADTMREMAADGVKRVIAIALAPHYSRISIGGYRKSVDAAQEALNKEFDVTFVETWHRQPEFLDFIASRVRSALERFAPEDRERVTVVFSAHSLPVRIREWNDPYERELLESSEAVARLAGVRDWRFAWQSAGETGEPWLGPDIVDYLDTLHGEGIRHVLQVPIGFVSDHLEILWDIDIEATEKARELGMTFYRTELPNTDAAFIHTLRAVVATAERAPETLRVPEPTLATMSTSA